VLGRIDLPAATGSDEAGSVVEARVARHDAGRLLTTLAFDGGEFHVPRIASAVGERVRARILARDVSLALRRPQAISILNILEGTVAAIGDQSGAIVDVQVTVGAVLVNARLTQHSVRELDVRVGRRVFVLVKAVALDQHTFRSRRRFRHEAGVRFHIRDAGAHPDLAIVLARSPFSKRFAIPARSPRLRAGSACRIGVHGSWSTRRIVASWAPPSRRLPEERRAAAPR
jgi:molybdopterin-binding protein